MHLDFESWIKEKHTLDERIFDPVYRQDNERGRRQAQLRGNDPYRVWNPFSWMTDYTGRGPTWNPLTWASRTADPRFDAIQTHSLLAKIISYLKELKRQVHEKANVLTGIPVSQVRRALSRIIPPLLRTQRYSPLPGNVGSSGGQIDPKDVEMIGHYVLGTNPHAFLGRLGKAHPTDRFVPTVNSDIVLDNAVKMGVYCPGLILQKIIYEFGLKHPLNWLHDVEGKDGGRGAGSLNQACDDFATLYFPERDRAVGRSARRRRKAAERKSGPTKPRPVSPAPAPAPADELQKARQWLRDNDSIIQLLTNYVHAATPDPAKISRLLNRVNQELRDEVAANMITRNTANFIADRIDNDIGPMYKVRRP